MFSIEEYQKIKKVHLVTVYRWLSTLKIFSYKQNGNTYIVDPAFESVRKLSKKTKRAIIDEHKAEWNLQIIKAHKDTTIAGLTSRQIESEANALRKKGFAFAGYTYKSNMRNISLSKTERQTRSDKFTHRNPILKSDLAVSKLIALAYKFYMQDSSASIRQLCLRIIMYAKKVEDFYELAAIPLTTLRGAVEREFLSLSIQEKHKLKNHYTLWNTNRIYSEGAFTKDIDFFEWYCMDDHVMEVAGAWVYNELHGKYELRKVYLWTIIETKTLNILGYMLKSDPFTADDIKMLFMEVLISAGKPAKGILMDNGLGAAKSCGQMLDRLGINHEPGPAYEPLHKAVQERMFGFVKTEFVSNWKNYIGGARKEVRHTSKKLSPEKCDFIIDTFIKEFDNYVEGFYQTKPRDRTDNDEKVNICIREDFNNRYLNFTPQLIEPKELRYAYMAEKYVKLDWSFINMGSKFGTYIPDEALHPVLNGKKYLVRYNPLDMREVDIYATVDMLIKDTGEVVYKGDFVATLHSQRSMGSQERQANVIKIRKQYEKSVRRLGDSVIDMTIVENIDAFAPELNEKGQILDNRKSLEKRVRDLIKDDSERLTKAVIDDTIADNDLPSEDAELEPVIEDNDGPTPQQIADYEKIVEDEDELTDQQIADYDKVIDDD